MWCMEGQGSSLSADNLFQLVDKLRTYPIKFAHTTSQEFGDSIGKNICKYRPMKKLRQEDLAKQADLSISYVGAMERNEKALSLELLIAAINALGVSAGMILVDVFDHGYIVKDYFYRKNLTSYLLRIVFRFTMLSTLWPNIQNKKTLKRKSLPES
jgi:transcriptional regulator with XRE-family HTH domain